MQINTFYDYTNPAFSGYYTKEAMWGLPGKPSKEISYIIENSNDILSKKAKKLFAALNTQIEETWAAIKKGKTDLKEPAFYLANRGKAISVKPVYGASKPMILMEVDDGKYTEKILFDRKNPQEFRYEKVVETDHGSATVKSFNSQVQEDMFITKSVNEMVEKYISKILTKNVVKDYFGQFYQL